MVAVWRGGGAGYSQQLRRLPLVRLVVHLLLVGAYLQDGIQRLSDPLEVPAVSCVPDPGQS